MSLVSSGHFVPQEWHDELDKQLRFIDQFMRDHNVPYWIIGGTLLGQIRESGRIKWDDDNDIGIPKCYIEDVWVEMKPEARKLGFQLEKTVHGLKLFSVIPGYKGIAGTDIFSYSLDTNDNIWVLGSEKSRKFWPNDFFFPEEVITQRKKFNGLEVECPNGFRYIKTLYGDDCLSVGRLMYNHVDNKPHDRTEKFRLDK